MAHKMNDARRSLVRAKESAVARLQEIENERREIKASLKSLPVECLILVDPDNPNFDEQGIAYAKARLQSQTNSLTIEVKLHVPEETVAEMAEEDPWPKPKKGWWQR